MSTTITGTLKVEFTVNEDLTGKDFGDFKDEFSKLLEITKSELEETVDYLGWTMDSVDPITLDEDFSLESE